MLDIPTPSYDTRLRYFYGAGWGILAVSTGLFFYGLFFLDTFEPLGKYWPAVGLLAGFSAYGLLVLSVTEAELSRPGKARSLISWPVVMGILVVAGTSGYLLHIRSVFNSHSALNNDPLWTTAAQILTQNSFGYLLILVGIQGWKQTRSYWVLALGVLVVAAAVALGLHEAAGRQIQGLEGFWTFVSTANAPIALGLVFVALALKDHPERKWLLPLFGLAAVGSIAYALHFADVLPAAPLGPLLQPVLYACGIALIGIIVVGPPLATVTRLAGAFLILAGLICGAAMYEYVDENQLLFFITSSLPPVSLGVLVLLLTEVEEQRIVVVAAEE